MYLVACGVLLAIGAALNLREWRGLLLTLLVGANIFAPMPMWSGEAFYAGCIIAELVVLVAAGVLICRQSEFVLYASALLVISHFMGYSLDAGSNPLSPYRGIVKLLEVSQLLACLALSPVLAPLLRNHDATTT
jgi:hypothetical protein